MLNRHTTMRIILTGALSLVVLSACSTRKHAAVMGGEGSGAGEGSLIAERMEKGDRTTALPMQPMRQEDLEGLSKEVPLPKEGTGLEFAKQPPAAPPAPAPAAPVITPAPPSAPSQAAPVITPAPPPAPSQAAPVITPAPPPAPSQAAPVITPASPRVVPTPPAQAAAPPVPPAPNLGGQGFEIVATEGVPSTQAERKDEIVEARLQEEPSPERSVDLGKVEEQGSSELTFSPSAPAIGGGEAMAPTSEAGTEFARAISPSDFVPDLPPQPHLPGQQPQVPGQQPQAELEGPIEPGPESGVTKISPPGKEEEVVKLPDRPADIEPLGRMPQDRRGAQGRQETALGHVYFDFDKFNIRPDAADTLAENARLLRSDLEDATILIEGHCDERGTNEYNMVLGERRAHAAKEYLVNLGVPSSRINTISYGEEKPFCTAHEPDCWQENRQGHFVLQRPPRR